MIEIQERNCGKKLMKPIRLSGHTKEQLFYRGVAEEEVIEAISPCTWQPAELGRLEARKDFDYENVWNKKYLKQSK